jgi:hypothetical protein
MASKVTIDMLIKKNLIQNRTPATRTVDKHYQVNYCGEHKDTYFCEIYETSVKVVENKIVYYKETVECRHLIF